MMGARRGEHWMRVIEVTTVEPDRLRVASAAQRVGKFIAPDRKPGAMRVGKLAEHAARCGDIGLLSLDTQPAFPRGDFHAERLLGGVEIGEVIQE